MQNPAQTAADALHMLAAFSLRVQMTDKAMRYARTGHEMFPERPEFVELYAYTLLHAGRAQEAGAVLDSWPSERTRNMAYVAARLAIVAEDAAAATSLRTYLHSGRGAGHA